MKLNRILLIGIILLAAISLNAISAADNTTSDIISELSIDEANDVAVESNADESIGDSGVYNIEKDSSNAIDSPASNSLNHVDKEVNDELLGDDATKITPNLTVTPSAQSYKYGSDVILTIKLVGDENSPIDGRVAVNVANENYVVDVTKGIGDLTITGLENGTYNVVAIFNATEQYNEAINSDATFIIEKSKKVTADVEVHDVVYGETVVVTISNLKNSDGTLLSNFGGFQLVGPEHPYGSFFVRKGKGTFDLKNLPAGNYSVYIVFGNNVGGDYEFENYILDFVVEKAPDKLIVNVSDYSYGNSGNLNVKVTDMNGKAISGAINVTVDGEVYATDVNVTGGMADVSLENIAIGNHTAEITFNSDNYKEAVVETQFNVIARDDSTYLSAENLVMSYKDGSSWQVILTDSDSDAISDATIKIGILGKVYNIKTDEKGIAKLPINLASGTYDINATFEGSEDYAGSFANATITVNKAATSLLSENLVMSYRDGSSWDVTLVDDYGNVVSDVNVALGVNGRTYNVKSDANGVARLTINLAPGTYEVNATFKGNSKYDASFTNATVTVNKAVVVLSSYNLTMSYKDGSSWDVSAYDDYGNVVSDVNIEFGIKGKTYNVKTDINGIAKLPVNLVPGSYNVNATLSSNKYEAELIEAFITVNKALLILSGNDIVMNYRDGSEYVNYLVDLNGKPISNTFVKFTILGKSYSVKTDVNGVAKLPISLNVGEYGVNAIVVDSKYESEEISNSITIKEYDAAIVASDVEMAYKDGTSYEAQLIDGEGNAISVAGLVVKFTILNKSYNVKTDEKGIARLPINLNVGNYTIKAEYNGNEVVNNIVIKMQ
jgi:hypothetical protein